MFATLYFSKAFQCNLCDLIWQNHKSHVKDLAACAQIHCVSVNTLLHYNVRLVAKNAHLASRMETADMEQNELLTLLCFWKTEYPFKTCLAL